MILRPKNFKVKLDLILTGFLLLIGASVHAQTKTTWVKERSFFSKMILGQASVPLKIKVSTIVESQTLGDADIPGHGFINHSLAIEVVENAVQCTQNLLIDQGDGPLLSSEIETCSGLKLIFQNPEKLLTQNTVDAKVLLKTSDAVLDKISFVFQADAKETFGSDDE